MAYWTLLKNNNSCKGTCDQELRNVENHCCASMDENLSLNFIHVENITNFIMWAQNIEK
jgi:hypothetical protein